MFCAWRKPCCSPSKAQVGDRARPWRAAPRRSSRPGSAARSGRRGPGTPRAAGRCGRCGRSASAPRRWRGPRATAPRARRGSGSRTCGSRRPARRGRPRRSGWRPAANTSWNVRAASVVKPPAEPPRMHSRSGSTSPRSTRKSHTAAQSSTSATPHCALQQVAVRAAVAGRAAVVDVDHREARGSSSTGGTAGASGGRPPSDRRGS